MTAHSRQLMLQASAGLLAVPVVSLIPSAIAQGQEVQASAFLALSHDPRFTTWVQLISYGGMQGAASGTTPFTMFTPTDQGLANFAQFRDAILGTMQGGGRSADVFPDTSRMVSIVRSLAVRGKHLPAELAGKVTELQSVQNTVLTVDGTKSPMTVTWTSTLLGRRLTASLAEPLITLNAVIYPEDGITSAS